MSKYLVSFTNTISEYFAYRLNFFLWRVRVIVGILITYFLWQSIFQGKTEVFGYSRTDMFTYILLITFLQGIVLSTQTHKVANEINTGDLSNLLIKPINYFGFNFARDLTDKFINTVFSFLEMLILIMILKPPVFLQTSPYWLGFFILLVVLAAILYFEINMLLSFIGFWSKETWAPRFIFYILVVFLAGTYFPLDIMPPPIYSFLLLLPFTYVVFFPLKVYLGSVSAVVLYKGLIIISIWIVVLGMLMNYLWKKGLKFYTAEGR